MPKPAGRCLDPDAMWLSVELRAGGRCALAPIRRGSYHVKNSDMQAIRCHAYAPVAPDELEGWLAREVDEIRAAAPNATVRFMRLSQAGSAGRVAVGWLIELEGIHGELALTDLQLDAVLRDMRLLGLQPTLLGSSNAGSRDFRETQVAHAH
jgi:hypothetical protein